MKIRLFTIFAIITITFSACVPAEKQVNTPTPSVLPTKLVIASATPEPQVVFLSQLQPIYASVGHAYLGVGVNPWTEGQITEGQPIVAHGRMYKNGLFAHAPSRIEYELGGLYSTLKTDITTHEGGPCGDGVVFRVLLDGKEAFKSNTVLWSDDPKSIEINAANVQNLALVADMQQDGGCDWAIWGDPYLTLADQATLVTPTPNPNLPCGGAMPERVYLFLDCNDIRRIREQVRTGSPEVKKAWDDLRASVDNYLSNFPTKLDPDESHGTLWWGGGNYIGRDMALVYLVTGDSKYAKGMVRLLDLITATIPNYTHLVNFDSDVHAPSYASGGLMSHPGYGEVVYQSTLFGYLAIRDSGLLGINDKEKYDAFFINQAFLLEEASEIIGNKSTLDGTGWRNAAVGPNIAAATIAIAFPEDEKIQQLYTRVRQHIDWQFANWWELDGGWGENTEGYGSRVMEGLLLFSEALLRGRGENLYTQNFDGRTLNRLCNYYTHIVTPEGTVPAISDLLYYDVDPGLLILCGYRTQDPILSFTFQQYLWGKHHGFGDDASGWDTLFHVIAWSGLENKHTPAPDYTSTLLSTTGLAILRDGWLHTSQYLLLKFTASKIHEHYDFGDLYLYDNGPWLVSNGYQNATQDDYARSIRTNNQSTLSLDGTNQTRLGGDLVTFADLNQTGVAGITSYSYDNMRHTRVVLWNKTGHQWIVVDDAQVTDDKRHTLMQYWYVRGAPKYTNENIWQFSRTANTDTMEITLLPNLPAKYTAISRTYAIDAPIVSAQGVQMSVSYPGRPLRLITSLASTKPAETTPIVVREDADSGTLVTSRRDGMNWIWILPASFSDSGAVGDYEISGTAGCVLSQSNLLQAYCLMNGTSLSEGEINFVRSDRPIYLETNMESKSIIAETTEDTQINLYWTTAVSKVFENGVSIPFSLDGNVVTLNLPAGRHVLAIQP